jgi:hypothetical protein
LPHAANFAPIGAIALFGGVYLNKRLALVVPMVAMLISDYFIGFDSWPAAECCLWFIFVDWTRRHAHPPKEKYLYSHRRVAGGVCDFLFGDKLRIFVFTRWFVRPHLAPANSFLHKRLAILQANFAFGPFVCMRFLRCL